MTTMTTARDHSAELTELKETVVHMLAETRHAARIQQAKVCAAIVHAEFMPYIGDCGIKADESTTGTIP